MALTRTALHCIAYQFISERHVLLNPFCAKWLQKALIVPLEGAPPVDNGKICSLNSSANDEALLEWTDTEGWTLLHCCAFFSWVKALESNLALELGELERKNRQGESALFLAARLLRLHPVKILLHAGADAATTDNNARTPTTAIGPAIALQSKKKTANHSQMLVIKQIQQELRDALKPKPRKQQEKAKHEEEEAEKEQQDQELPVGEEEPPQATQGGRLQLLYQPPPSMLCGHASSRETNALVAIAAVTTKFIATTSTPTT